jgi:hypothetical protein
MNISVTLKGRSVGGEGLGASRGGGCWWSAIFEPTIDLAIRLH